MPQTLVDRLWDFIAPALAAHERRSADAFRYELLPGAPPILHQAECMLVALEHPSLRTAFVAFATGERWAALVTPPTSAAGWAAQALLHAAQCTAGERIAMALPEPPRGEETRVFRVIDGGKGR